MPKGKPTELPSPSGVHDRQVRRFVAGAVAGDVTVPGINVGDGLIQVVAIDPTTGVPTDLTSEFTITAADTINNTGGTSTSGDTVYVEFYDTDLGFNVQYWDPS